MSYFHFEIRFRSTLATTDNTVEELIELLEPALTNLLQHDFIAKKQSQYLREIKNQLEPGCVLVIGDFAENYSFVVQDAIQGYYWSNDQATVHPWTCYYRSSEDIEVQHLSIAMISDCLKHDVFAVATFQKQLVKFIKSKLPAVHKIIYYSDGAGSQYKNRKNFLNVCLHEHDYGIPAEWHFFASYHGKGPCDGLGGTLKRGAARASLQRPYDNQILTPIDLYNWAQIGVPNISTVFVSQEEILEMENSLKSRFSGIKTISGTRGYHCFIPASTGTIIVKTVSDSIRREEFKITDDLLTLQSVHSDVIIVLNEKWWVGRICKKNAAANEFSAILMEPHGPAVSYKFPVKEKTVTLGFETIVTEVKLVKKGKKNLYTVSKREENAIIRKCFDYLTNKQLQKL